MGNRQPSPIYGKFPLKIGASGEMALRVEDSRKLLIKIVGTEYFLTQAALTQMFCAFLMAKVKPYLAKTMQDSGFGIFEVDSHMGELSEALHKQLIPDFKDYGLSLERFFVTTIVKPEGDPAYEKFRDIHVRQYSDIAEAQLRQKVGIIDQQTSAQKMVIESQAIATKRAQEGYTYQHERGFDVAEKVAQNEAIGNFTNAGIGLGMMGGMAGGLGTTVAGITTDALNQITPQNGAHPVVAGFGIAAPAIDPKTGTPPPAPTAPTDDMAAFKQKLEKIKAMKDMGMLSDEEFETEKKKLLSTL